MDRHPFDPVSLVFGLVLAVAGIIAVSGGSIVEDGRWLLPAGLIGLGLALVLPARAAGKRDQGWH